MTSSINTLPVVILVGIGLEVIVLIALMVFFRLRGWLSVDGTVPSPEPARRPSARALAFASAAPGKAARAAGHPFLLS